MKYTVSNVLGKTAFDSIEKALEWVRVCLLNDIESTVGPEWP
jgi:hypothetical protein